MAPRQLSFFLHWAAEFHEDLRAFYERKRTEADHPEVETLLYFLARHEDALARLLTIYEHDAPRDILDAWFTVAPDLRAVRRPEELEFGPDATVDEVIDKALAMNENLLTVYRMLVRQAVPERLREVLEDLIAQEEREQSQLMRARP